jgi:hypothetical protein
MVDEGIQSGASGRRSTGAKPNGHRFGAVSADVGARSKPVYAEFDGERWESCNPRSNRALHPYNDNDSAEIVEEAVRALISVRAPMWRGDGAVTTSVLVSLAREAEGCLFDAVADARDQDYSWEEIARHLGTSERSARRRYGSALAARRRTICDAREQITDGLMTGDDR